MEAAVMNIDWNETNRARAIRFLRILISSWLSKIVRFRDPDISLETSGAFAGFHFRKTRMKRREDLGKKRKKHEARCNVVAFVDDAGRSRKKQRLRITDAEIVDVNEPDVNPLKDPFVRVKRARLCTQINPVLNMPKLAVYDVDATSEASCSR